MLVLLPRAPEGRRTASFPRSGSLHARATRDNWGTVPSLAQVVKLREWSAHPT